MMLNEGTIQKIQHFIAEDRADSEVEVIRQAVSYYHDKIYPNYVFHLTPAAKKKQKEYEKEEQEANITNDEFAAKIKFTPIFKSNGDKFYFFRGLGHSPQIIPEDQIREYVEKHPYVVADNAKECAWESVKSYFSNSWGDVFREKNDLLMPEFEDEDENEE